MRSKTWVVVVAVLVMVLGTAGIAGAITNGEPDAGRRPYVGLLVFEDWDPPRGSLLCGVAAGR
jgi:hypothetical protein